MTWIMLRRWWHNLKAHGAVDGTGAVRLWVDDLRPAPEGWHWAGTVDHAKDVLVSGFVVEMSLDHDLGPGETGYDLVKWITKMKEELGLNYWPLEAIRVHSANPGGRYNMQCIIDRYGPYPKRGERT